MNDQSIQGTMSAPLLDESLLTIGGEVRLLLAGALRGRPLGDDDDIFRVGLLNSLAAMELVLSLERTFGISVETEDLDLDNFRSVRRLSALVWRIKQRQGVAE